MHKILITGTAGFIGFHLVNRLIKEGYNIIGLDNINDYYDVTLKYDRLKETGILKNKISTKARLITSNKYSNYRFIKLDLLDREELLKLFKRENFDFIIHLAAQAGVRYSLENPKVYIESNIIGFFNLLEACRFHKSKHLIFASSSSVYGNNTKVPFSTEDKTDTPISLYAATKKSNEVMAYSYSILYGIPTTGLRFFTVYGPWGRPDMAYYSFSKNITEEKEIKLFNNGKMRRDFTYIDDVTISINKLLLKLHRYSNEKNDTKYKIYNIGNSKPVELEYLIKLLEKYYRKKTKLKYLPEQKGEVKITYADNRDLYNFINYKPKIDIETGLKKFCHWFENYNRESNQ